MSLVLARPGTDAPTEAVVTVSGGLRAWLRGQVSSLVGLALLDASVAASDRLLAARLLAVVLVVALPGAAVVAAARVRLDDPGARLALVVGAGVAALMAWAAVGSAALPPLGLSRPLDRLPTLVAVNVIVVVGAAVAPRRHDPLLGLVAPDFRLRSWWRPAVAALLPLAGVVGAERVNAGAGWAVVAVAVVAVLAAVVMAVVRAGAWGTGRIQCVLFAAGLCLIYLYTFRTNHLFGFDIQQEFQRFSFTAAAGRWTPPSNGDAYASMLSITALPAALTHVTGLSGLAVFKGVYPLFLAALAPLTFSFARRWVSPRPAVIAAAYLILLSQFSGQLSAITRQEVGLFYFALLAVVLADTGPAPRRRTVIAAGVLAALVVSHYSTSYVTVTMLAATWVVYAACRAARRWPRRGGKGSPGAADRPLVTLPLVAFGALAVVAWDVWYTASSSNVTSFLTNLADKGPDVLPNARGSVLNTWLNGNITPAASPAEYYALAHRSSVTSQPWLHAYPAAATSAYPASAAPPTGASGLGHAGLSALLAHAYTTVGQLFLLVVVLGTVALVLWRRRASTVPLEVALLSGAFLAFVAVIRVSGTVAGSYNQERAQLQAGVILSVALAFAIQAAARRLRVVTATAATAGLLVLGATATGVVAQIGGGGSPIWENAGTAYDHFAMTDQDVAAAHWLVANGGPDVLIWTDQFGELRVWAGSDHAAATQVDLTPATVDQGAWVLATGANVEGRAYGSAGGRSATYRFPAAFLGRSKAVVYSSPLARVYR